MTKLETMVFCGVLAIVNLSSAEHVTGRLGAASGAVGMVMLAIFFGVAMFGKSGGSKHG